MKVSLIISTYNRPDALRVCLDSVCKQVVLPDEVLIGDDGSTDETACLIEEVRPGFPVPLLHVWHEDEGFRLAMMRNKCVAKASGEYIIEIDGDVFLHPLFIADHLREAGKGIYVKGGRANLNRETTKSICREGVARTLSCRSGAFESKSENAWHCGWLAHFLASRYRKHRSAALGCNLSFFREDFVKINGYDEFFEGWGGEDIDLGNRLQRSGCRKRYLKFSGIVYHLWHEDKFMYNREKNFAYEAQQNVRRTVRCTDGVDKYL